MTFENSKEMLKGKEVEKGKRVSERVGSMKGEVWRWSQQSMGVEALFLG